MQSQRDELIKIITKFAESGWDLIDAPAKTWLRTKDNSEESKTAAIELISAIEKADQECGSCGCEFDLLYKKALAMKNLIAPTGGI